jgi:hypothetical protein
VSKGTFIGGTPCSTTLSTALGYAAHSFHHSLEETKMKAKVICIEGYWKDDHKRFERRCVVMPNAATDSMATDILEGVKGSLGFHNDIFYVFGEDERIVGEHREFVVDFCNPIYEIEMGELQ